MSLRTTLGRLERLQRACGGLPEEKKDDPDANIDFSQMSSYAKAQYKLASRMQNFRQKTEALGAMGSGGDLPTQAAARNFLRKEMAELNKDMKSIIPLGTGAHAEELAQLKKHFGNTEKMYRRMTGVDSGYDDYGAASTRRGVTNVVDLDAADIVGGGPSIRDDPEFQQFFAKTRENDVAMDEKLTRIHHGIQRLNQNAVLITDELKIQDTILTDIEVKVDKTLCQLVGLNRKLKDTLRKVDRDRMFIYVFCCILLLALAGGCYYLVAGRD